MEITILIEPPKKINQSMKVTELFKTDVQSIVKYQINSIIHLTRTNI